jgi:S1-C subfamily serine protease
VTNSDNFIAIVSTYKPGQTITVTVKQLKGGSTKQLKVTLGNRPASAPTAG